MREIHTGVNKAGMLALLLIIEDTFHVMFSNTSGSQNHDFSFYLIFFSCWVQIR